jgi:PAS domain S-box-containing protein
MNPAWESALGYTLAELRTGSLYDIIHPDDVKNTRDTAAELLSNGEVKNFINRYRCKDGSYRWFEWRATSADNLIYSVARDITDRKASEENLKESEERYRVTLKNMPDAVSIMKCSDLKYLYVNDTFCRVLGYTSEELMEKTPYDLNLPVTAEDHENLQKFITNKSGTLSQAFKFRTRDGTELDTLTSFTPILYAGQESMIVVVTDVTPLKLALEETKKLESQLAQVQKMEALGTLAGGIAHDFNNILAAIIGYAELAMYQAKSPEKVQKHLAEVLKSSKRARDLVSQILSFSRQGEKKYTPVMLSFAIKETIKMLRSIIPTNIEIRQNLMAAGLAMADPIQIHQMMMNLGSNAVQAMGERGGVLEVDLHQVIIDEPTAHTLDLTPGSYLRLTVSDTGHGMTPELMSHIFEPYFTTRDVGRGTGLGLSIVHGIVIRHRGAITCRSEPGKGTTFEIYLPEIELGEKEKRSLEETELPRGTERILFVDDEPALGDITKKLLENLGYRVTTTTSSREALNLFVAYPNQFDLVITDMTMPDMTGDRLAQKIIAVRKDVPVILCTGYSDHITEEKVTSIGIKELLMKPLEMKVFAHTIRKILDSRE